MWRVLAVLLFLSTSATAKEPTALVFTAASMSDALTRVAEAYAATGQPRPTLSFASSAVLARQIENGAPASIIVSADEVWMDYLSARDLIVPSSRVTLVRNNIVLVVPKAKPLQLEIGINFPLATSLAGEKLAIADPDSVPAGRYAKAALENLGVWRSVEGNVVRSENVRAALTLVERGEAAAGVVYATDAALSQRVMVVGTFPNVSHPPITYPMALLRPGTNEAAASFFAFATSAPAREIYKSFGFVVE